MALADSLTFYHSFTSLTPDWPTSGLTKFTPSGSSDISVSGGIGTCGTGSGGVSTGWTLGSGEYLTGGTGDFTIAARLKITTEASNANSAVCIGNAGARRYVLRQKSTVNDSLEAGDPNSGTFAGSGNSAFTVDTYFVWVARRVSGVFDTYINGTLSGADSVLDSYDFTGTYEDITLGSLIDGTSDFNGAIDWVCVWNRAITDSEKDNNMNEADISSALGLSGTVSISATASTGIQHWTGPLQLVGITKTLPILLGESRFEGFAGSPGFGRQADILLGQMRAEGFTPSIAKAVTILLGEQRAQGFAPTTAIIRTYLGLLGELRALGFTVSSEPAQTANIGIGYANFTGIAGSVSTVAPASTITASALLRETQAVGFIGQVIRVVFPITGTAHFDGYGAQTLEFIKVISGPDIGEMQAEGIAATALIGQIRNYTISLGEVGFYALQQALTIQRTLDILVGQTNYTGIEPSLAIIRGGEINLGPQVGVVTLEGLINATANVHRTAFGAVGLANAEGFGPAAPAGQISVQSVLGEMYASGFVPLVSFNRYFAQVGQARFQGFAPDITYGLWRPIKRRLTTWASI